MPNSLWCGCVCEGICLSLTPQLTDSLAGWRSASAYAEPSVSAEPSAEPQLVRLVHSVPPALAASSSPSTKTVRLSLPNHLPQPPDTPTFANLPSQGSNIFKCVPPLPASCSARSHRMYGESSACRLSPTDAAWEAGGGGCVGGRGVCSVRVPWQPADGRAAWGVGTWRSMNVSETALALNAQVEADEKTELKQAREDLKELLHQTYGEPSAVEASPVRAESFKPSLRKSTSLALGVKRWSRRASVRVSAMDARKVAASQIAQERWHWAIGKVRESVRDDVRARLKQEKILNPRYNLLSVLLEERRKSQLAGLVNMEAEKEYNNRMQLETPLHPWQVHPESSVIQVRSSRGGPEPCCRASARVSCTPVYASPICRPRLREREMWKPVRIWEG